MHGCYECTEPDFRAQLGHRSRLRAAATGVSSCAWKTETGSRRARNAGKSLPESQRGALALLPWETSGLQSRHRANHTCFPLWSELRAHHPGTPPSSRSVSQSPGALKISLGFSTLVLGIEAGHLCSCALVWFMVLCQRFKCWKLGLHSPRVATLGGWGYCEVIRLPGHHPQQTVRSFSRVPAWRPRLWII